MSFEKRKAVPLVAAFLIAVGIGSTATADTGVEIYSTNVTLNGGDIGLGGGDIRDSGVTVWNSSQGFVPAASVEVNPIQSGTTSSDVGLGQVENEAQVAESGDKITGTLNMTGNTIDSVAAPSDSDDAVPRSWVDNNAVTDDGSADYQVGGTLTDVAAISDVKDPVLGAALSIEAEGSSSKQLFMAANGPVHLQSDLNDGGFSCRLKESGSFNCEGAKNWVHDLNTTHKAVYSAQESPEVRAVYEGQAATSNGRVNVSLPSHFSKTVSDTRPSLRVQVTPHSLASVAVTERTDDYLVVESSKDVTVDYRVTGIREGYEDKQVVRKK